MTIEPKDILNTVCTEVKEIGNNALQTIYTVADPKEAKIAFDILIAYGFNAKIYHTPQNPSKLYVTNATIELPQSDDQPLTYAKILKQIKQSLDGLPSPNYTVHFTNAQPGKQITIQISTPATMAVPVTQPAAAAATSSAAAISQPVAAPKGRRVKKVEEDSIDTGPAVAKASYSKVFGEKGDRKDTARKRIFLYFFGNIATSSFAFLVMVVILAIIFSFFVFAKAFICPDFASMKRNHSWYCSMFTQQDDDDDKKQQHKQQP